MERVIKVAAQTAIEHVEKMEKEKRKKRIDRRLRNTRLLLTNYKNFKLQCTENITEIEQLDDPNLMEYLDTDDLVIESIKLSKQRTLVMVAFIERMIEVYRVISLTSGKQEESRKYETIKKLYFSEEEMTHEKVADVHKVTLRTVYRDVDSAVKTLSSLIFGVDSIRFDY